MNHTKSCSFAFVALLLFGFATARADYATDYASYSKDMQEAWDAPEFATVRTKTTLDDGVITPSMTLTEEMPSAEERQAMLHWADKLSAFKTR